MFEGIILILISIIVGLTTMLALFLLISGLVKKSKPLIQIGLIICIIPAFLIGLFYWYYNIHLPNINKQEESKYTGTYFLQMTPGTDSGDFKTPKTLILHADNTFELNKSEVFDYSGHGSWRSGATDDGQLEFKNDQGHILFWAMPINYNRLEINPDMQGRHVIIFQK